MGQMRPSAPLRATSSHPENGHTTDPKDGSASCPLRSIETTAKSENYCRWAQRYIVGGRVPAKGISGAVAEKVFSATMPTRKPSWIRRAERVDEVYA